MFGVEAVCLPAPTKTSTWLRRKEEIEALKQEQDELENALLFMEMKCMTASNSGEVIEMNCHQARSKAVALVAKRQREAAEDENRRLKKQVQNYMRQCEAFRNSLENTEFQRSNLVHCAMASQAALRVELVTGRSLRFSDTSIFSMLERRVDARVSELSEAFSKLRLETSSAGFERFKTHLQDDKMGSLHLSLVQLIPFERQVATSALWAIAETGKFPAGDHSRAVKRSKDAYAIHSELSVQLENGGTIDINGHSVMKKFPTPTGSGTLVEACAQWTIRLPGADAWSHMTREAGCFVLHSYASGGDNVPEVCALRAEVRLDPGDFVGDMPQNQQRKSDMLREVVIPSFRRQIHARHQFVENELLDIVR